MFNRPDERRELLHHIAQGRSILMLAPRRIGKTWLMKKFAEDLRAEGWRAVFCDVQGVDGPTAFFAELCDQMQIQGTMIAKVKGRGKQIWGRLFAKDVGDDWKTALLKTDWSSFAETLVHSLHESGQKTVILVDELALFIHELARRDAATAKDFLYRLRALDGRYPNVRWFFTGSIGLDIIAKREGIGGALLDLTLFPIEPFSLDAARAFLVHLSATGRLMRPFELDDDGFARLVAQLGWLSPYYLEHVAMQIRPSGAAGPNGPALATLDDIDAGFSAMLDPLHRNYFVAWEEHLAKNFSSHEAATMQRILGACAMQAGGESLDTLTAKFHGPPDAIPRRMLRDYLAILTTDGYLAEITDGETSRYRFRSGLLRRYWLRWHVA